MPNALADPTLQVMREIDSRMVDGTPRYELSIFWSRDENKIYAVKVNEAGELVSKLTEIRRDQIQEIMTHPELFLN